MAIGLVASVGAFAASSAPDFTAAVDRCRSYTPLTEARMAACSTVLDMQGLLDKTAALAHFYRGVAELSIERPDDTESLRYEKNAQAALVDLDAAITIDPTFVAAYRYRANLYRYLHIYDKAVADIDKVIAAYPKLADLHALRGKLLTDLRQFDAALTEFDTAFALAGADDDLPRLHLERASVETAAGLWDLALADIDKSLPGLKKDRLRFGAESLRGRVNFLAGNMDAAITDFRSSQKLADEKDVHYLLWLYLAEAHQGQDAARHLWEQLPFVDTTTWPGPLLRYFAGDLSLSEVALPTDWSDFGRKGALCEREFFLGEYALLKNQRAEALQHFQQAIDTGITSYVEYRAAQIELKKLGQ